MNYFDHIPRHNSLIKDHAGAKACEQEADLTSISGNITNIRRCSNWSLSQGTTRLRDGECWRSVAVNLNCEYSCTAIVSSVLLSDLCHQCFIVLVILFTGFSLSNDFGNHWSDCILWLHNTVIIIRTCCMQFNVCLIILFSGFTILELSATVFYYFTFRVNGTILMGNHLKPCQWTFHCYGISWISFVQIMPILTDNACSAFIEIIPYMNCVFLILVFVIYFVSATKYIWY